MAEKSRKEDRPDTTSDKGYGVAGADKNVEAVRDSRAGEQAITQDDQQPEDAIGRSSATERAPNSSEKFSFWLKPSNMINPFDIVAANQGLDKSITYGLVTNIRHSTDAPSHLSNYLSLIHI